MPDLPIEILYRSNTYMENSSSTKFSTVAEAADHRYPMKSEVSEEIVSIDILLNDGVAVQSVASRGIGHPWRRGHHRIPLRILSL